MKTISTDFIILERIGPICRLTVPWNIEENMERARELLDQKQVGAFSIVVNPRLDENTVMMVSGNQAVFARFPK